MITTPPPPEIHIPTAPLHGPMFDAPHISNRRSDRIRNQKRIERTPSPGYNTSSFDSEAPGELKRTPKSKRPTAYFSPRSSSHHNLSPPSSPADREFDMASTRSSAPAAKQAENLHSHPSAVQAGLPTPMKTPRKQISHSGNAQAARVLFSQSYPSQREQPESGRPSDQFPVAHLPTPMSKKRSKRARKTVGFSLDGELERATGVEDDGIEIYTDSHEMIPERDDSVENPFYVRPGAPKKKYTKRVIKAAQVKDVERGIELLKDDRGYFAVGRGRRYWKVIDQAADIDPHSPSEQYGKRMLPEDEMEEDETNELHTTLDLDDVRFTRRSLRPRRLFAPDVGEATSSREQQNNLNADDDEEEATTDIEEPEKHGLLPPDTSNDQTGPANHASQGTRVSTCKPDSQSMPALPLTGTADKSIDLSASPFDSWPRRKPSRACSSNNNGKKLSATTTIKREGEPMSSTAKRSRGSS